MRYYLLVICSSLQMLAFYGIDFNHGKLRLASDYKERCEY